MLRSVWVDHGDNPEPVSSGKNGITRPLFDIRDESLTTNKLLTWRDHSPYTSIGVYACANWNVDKDWSQNPAAFAIWLDRRISAIAPNTGSRLPCVAVNIENGWTYNYNGRLPTYCADFFKEWRNRRPTRITTLVLDGFQGGYWDKRPADVQAIKDADLEEIQVEAFNGSDMSRFDSDGVVYDVESRGFSNVVPIHSGKQLAPGWFGGVFTQGSLLGAGT